LTPRKSAEPRSPGTCLLLPLSGSCRIPVFSECFGRQDDAAAWELLNNLLTTTLCALLGVWVLGATLSVIIVPIQIPGLEPATIAAAVRLSRLVFGLVLCQGLASILQSVLYARHRYVLCSSGKLLSNVLTAQERDRILQLSSDKKFRDIIQALYDGQDELRKDNAALEQEKLHLWEAMQRLTQYAYIAEHLDAALVAKIAEIETTDPDKAKTLREDVLFYARQKHQDLLTQLAVSIQGYLAIDLVKRNNTELIKGVDRATTTTIAALRTAVIVAQALSNQKLVLDQIDALNTTTSSLIESTSQLLATQSVEINKQAASSTVSLDSLKAAFQNVYQSMDAIDAFKEQALESMAQTVTALKTEIDGAQTYLNLGFVYYELGFDREAQEAFEMASKLQGRPCVP